LGGVRGKGGEGGGGKKSGIGAGLDFALSTGVKESARVLFLKKRKKSFSKEKP